MTFDVFRHASEEDLRKEAKACYDRAEQLGDNSLAFRTGLLEEAQFYLSQLDRQHGARIARRDHLLEIAVIVLIGFEIVLSLFGLWVGKKQADHEDELMSKQNNILSEMQATSVLATEATKSLVESTAKMSILAQRQLDLAIQPAVTVEYSDLLNQVQMTNKGNPNITVWGFRVGGRTASLDKQGSLIRNGAMYRISWAFLFPMIRDSVTRSRTTGLPLEIYLTDDNGREYVASSNLTVTRRMNDALEIASGPTYLTRHNWRLTHVR